MSRLLTFGELTMRRGRSKIQAIVRN